MSDAHEDPLCLVFVPALVVLLYKAESEKMAPLTEDEVLSIRNNATCMMVSYSVALQSEKLRGYGDIAAEQCWEQWQVARLELFCNK